MKIHISMLLTAALLLSCTSCSDSTPSRSLTDVQVTEKDEDVTTEPPTTTITTNATTVIKTTATTDSKPTTTSVTKPETTTVLTTTTKPAVTTVAPTEPPTEPPTEAVTEAVIERNIPEPDAQANTIFFILNTETNCVHTKSNCTAAKAILPENYSEIYLNADELGTYEGVYWACGKCAKSYSSILPKP